MLSRLVFISAVFFSGVAHSEEISDHLQRISVTVRSESGFSKSEGSGVIVTRTIEGKKVNFVWTAAHVIDNLRKVKRKIVGGKALSVIEFSPVHIVKELYENDELVGEIRMRAKVIKYSNADEGHDLALLQINKSNFINESAKFNLNSKTPGLGTELYHVGSLLGQVGSNSMTSGIVSSVGRKLRGLKYIFDQTTVTALPGSSGGGVYLKRNGEYIGMLVRGMRGTEGFNFIVPLRRMVSWAKANRIYWALDPNSKMPTFKQIASLPVEGTFIQGSVNPKVRNLYKFYIKTDKTALEKLQEQRSSSSNN